MNGWRGVRGQRYSSVRRESKSRMAERSQVDDGWNGVTTGGTGSPGRAGSYRLMVMASPGGAARFRPGCGVSGHYFFLALWWVAMAGTWSILNKPFKPFWPTLYVVGVPYG